MATAFNPNTGSQNVYSSTHYMTEADYLRGSLDQELVAAVDLFGPTTTRGPLGALEYCVEWLSTTQKERIAQSRLAAHGKQIDSISTIKDMIEFIDSDDVLQSALKETLKGQSRFFKEFISYSDKTIRLVSDKGIDNLFPGRLHNADILQSFSDDMLAGKSALEIYQSAEHIAQSSNHQ